MTLRSKLTNVLQAFPLPVESPEDRAALLETLVQSFKEGESGPNALLFSHVCERARWALSRARDNQVYLSSADLRVLLAALGEA